MKITNFINFLTIALLTCVSLNVSTELSSQAQDVPPSPRNSLRFIPPDAPQSAPSGRGRGGASRTGSCPTVTQPLTALVPTVDRSVWGLTTAERPSFWFYVPYVLNTDHSAEFVLLDEQNKYIYQTPLADTAAAQTGIIQVALPLTVSLAENKTYQWILLVNCETASVFIRGSIQRVPASAALTAQLNQAVGALNKARIYAENGLWFDALGLVADLKRAEPQNGAIATEWRSFLESAGLADVADQALLP